MSDKIAKQLMEAAFISMKVDAKKMGLKFTKKGTNWNIDGEEKKVREFLKKYQK